MARRKRETAAKRSERSGMHLSATAEYALRAMAYLATLRPGESARASDLEAATSASAPYLAKVLRKLVVAGLLVSRKGHHGGFALARPPARIRFVEVLEAVGHSPDPKRCAFGWGECDPRAPCPLHDAWSGLAVTFRDWAATTTLGDIRPAPARQRLPLARPSGRSPSRPITG